MPETNAAAGMFKITTLCPLKINQCL